MMTEIPIYCGVDAIGRLIRFCLENQHRRFLLVSDANTYRALGRIVEQKLGERGWDVRAIILDGGEIIADEKNVFNVLYHAEGERWLYLAVGSGTITDITRYASFCARNPFVSLPTAPSVDAYAAGGAALVMGGYKLTVRCQAPVAIFADLSILCDAPYPMVAAGFGDILGKFTSLADWRLGALLLDEPFDTEIWERSCRALSHCVAHAAEIAQISPAGIQILIAGLFESGLCMMQFGSSRPASGAEHLFSHYWDILHLQQGRPPVLHGAQVGVGTVLAARRYETIRELSQDPIVERLAAVHLPSTDAEIDRIRRIFGVVADRVIANHLPFLQLLEANKQRLAERILDRWTDIQSIVADVPSSQEIRHLLGVVKADSDPQAIGLAEAEVRDALRHAHFLRARFTVDTLCRMLGL